ncbi:MAG TPA: hypothetical protein VG734_10915 [Lacunisphaera sp.]|nr:hypothetical protein [Lacunisphaera sp.]
MRLARRINLAIWLEHFAPLAFLFGSAAAIALFALRRTEGPVTVAWLGLAAGLAGSGGFAWWRGRLRFHRPGDARVLLESTLRLDARLSAAVDGVAPWPARSEVPPVVRWSSLAAPGWLAAAVVLLAAGALLPVFGRTGANRRPTEKPPSLAQTEAMLEELAKLEVADPASLEQLDAQARELAERSPEEQYTHSALEAADTLRDQTMTAVQNLARGYDGAAAALTPFESRDANSDADTKGADDRLAAALDGLRSGRLAGNPELSSLLSAARQMSPEQLKQLRDRLNQAGAGARGVAGAAGAGAKIARPGDGAGEEGEGPGNGGADRGRGDAPLTMMNDPTAEQAGKLEALSPADLERATLGDFAGMERGGAPQVDPTKLGGPASAGDTAARALGGEAVWIDRLSPSDRAILREVFK